MKQIVYAIIFSLILSPAVFSSAARAGDGYDRREDRLDDKIADAKKEKRAKAAESATAARDLARCRSELEKLRSRLGDTSPKENPAGDWGSDKDKFEWGKNTPVEDEDSRRRQEEFDAKQAYCDELQAKLDGLKGEEQSLQEDIDRYNEQIDRLSRIPDPQPGDECISGNCPGRHTSPNTGKSGWEVFADVLKAATPLGVAGMNTWLGYKGMKMGQSDYRYYADAMIAQGLPIQPNSNGYGGIIGSVTGANSLLSMFMNGYGSMGGNMFGGPMMGGGFSGGFYPGMGGGFAPYGMGGGFAAGSVFAGGIVGGFSPYGMGGGFAPYGMGGGYAPYGMGMGGGGFAAGSMFAGGIVGGFSPYGMGGGYAPYGMGMGYSPYSIGGGFAPYAAGGGAYPIVGAGYSAGGFSPYGYGGYAPYAAGMGVGIGMAPYAAGMGTPYPYPAGASYVGGFAAGNMYGIGMAPYAAGMGSPYAAGAAFVSGIGVGGGFAPYGQAFAPGAGFSSPIGQPYPYPGTGTGTGSYPGSIYPGGQYPYASPFYGMNPSCYGGLCNYNPYMSAYNSQYNAGGWPSFYQNQQQQAEAQMRLSQQQAILGQDAQVAGQALSESQNRYYQVVSQMSGSYYGGGTMAYGGAGYTQPYYGSNYGGYYGGGNNTYVPPLTGTRQ